MRRGIALLALLFLWGSQPGCKSCGPATEQPMVKSASAPTPEAARGPQTSWLDPPLTNWNEPGKEVPLVPNITVDDATKERCKAQNRPPTSPEDKAVAGAGWTLFGPLQTFGNAAILSGMATVDVDCHPVAMQTFVFRDGKFAGTVSPKPMDSLTDGAQRLAFLTGEDFLAAEFARYAADDQPCCPSRFATTAYKIKSEEQGPVVVPLEVKYRAAPKS